MWFWDWLGNNAAVIVAICALVFTAYQAYLSRSYNRISIRPHITTFVTRNSSQGVGTLKVELCNNGLGPAIIKELTYQMDGTPISFFDPAEALIFLEGMVGRIGIECMISTYAKNTSFKVADSRPLFSIVFDEGTSGQGWEHIEQFIDSFSIEVNYESLYGEKFRYNSIS